MTQFLARKHSTGQKNRTILPTPGDPTNMTLSTEDTNASPVSANLEEGPISAIADKNNQRAKRKNKMVRQMAIPCYHLNKVLWSSYGS